MMDRLKTFSQVIEKGNYVFHLHTDLTDGSSNLSEYFVLASKLGKFFIFTEHVRKEITYDWMDYINTIHEAGYLAGFEAKVMPGGDIDIGQKAYESSDVLAIAVHSFKVENYDILVSSLRRAFEDHLDDSVPLVWVHPTTSKTERRLVDNKEKYIDDVMSGFEKDVWLESNVRRTNFLNEEIERLSKKYKIIIGLDAHSVDEVSSLLKK